MAPKYDPSRSPGYRKITKIELSEEKFHLRAGLAIGFFVLGIVAIAVGLFSLLNKEPGWQTVEANSSGPSCAGDFQLQYDFSEDAGGATAAYKRLTQIYTEAAESGYRIFSVDVSEEGLFNVAYLNQHVNEIVTVDPALYQALKLVDAYGVRGIYLAPVYREYDRLFLTEDASEAVRYDPAQNQELMAFIQEIVAFSSNPQEISLTFYEDNQVQLHISEACIAFSEEYGIEAWVDFSWMKNAFLIDYLAQCLVDSGFTHGYLASYDGFTRNLDERGLSYSLNLFNRVGDSVEIPAVYQYDSPRSIVFLRNYPLSDADRWHYYSFSDGHIATIFLDAEDGKSKSSRNNLVSYAENVGCAEVLMQMIPVYLADAFSQDGLAAMATRDVYSIWFDEKRLCYNDPDGSITLQESGKDFTLNLVS